MHRTLLAFLFVLFGSGCPTSSTLNDCGEHGTFASDSVGMYCGYAVIAGGFRECPAFAPHRFTLRNARGETLLVCSSRSEMGGSLPLPSALCTDLDAMPGCRAEAASELVDGGTRTDAGPAPMEGEVCSDDTRVFCDAVRTGLQCCGGQWRAIVDGPCATFVDILDAGPVCDGTRVLAGCPCDSDGVTACPTADRLRLVCRAGMWAEDVERYENGTRWGYGCSCDL